MSYFEKAVKARKEKQGTNDSDSSPATSAAEEASKSSEAEAEAAGVTPVQEGDAPEGKQGKGKEESTLTIDFGE